MKRLLLPFTLLLFSSFANAQETAPSSNTPKLESLITTISEPFVVESDKPAPIKANFLEVIENTDGLKASRSIVGLENVKIEGVLSPEDQGAMPLDGTLSSRDLKRMAGSITWSAVSTENTLENGEKKVERAMLLSPLESSLNIEGDTVSTGTKVEAKGDIDAAIKTAKTLINVNISDEAASETKAKEEPVNETQDGSPRQSAGGELGGTDTGNSLAGLKSYDTAAVEAAVTYSTSTEGCEPVANIEGGYMSITSRVTENGAPTGSCADNGERPLLQKGYASCADEVITDQKKVYDRFRYFYVYLSETKYVDDENSCRRDEDRVFDIIEDKKACTYRQDLTAMAAYKQAETGYMNAENSWQKISDCTDIIDAVALPITETTDICGITHDFNTKVSTQLTRKTFEDAGVTYQVSPCTVSSTTYPHVLVTNVCPVIDDLSAMLHIEQIRYKITTPNGDEYVSLCTPDTENQKNILSTTDGCTDQFVHDVPAGISTGTERFYYVTSSGSREYVTTCKEDIDRTYTHSKRITEYEDHDTELFGYPLTEIYINTEFGKKQVQTSQVLSDAVQIPYVYNRAETVESGVSTYEPTNGCSKYKQTKNAEIYNRPDGTEYNRFISDGAAIGPAESCTTSGALSSADWPLTSDSGATTGNSNCSVISSVKIDTEGNYSNTYQCTRSSWRTCTYGSTKNTTRDDGYVVSSLPLTWSFGKTTSASCTSSPTGCTAGFPTPPASCSETMPSSEVSTARSFYGI